MIQGLEKPKASEDKVTFYCDRTWEQFKYLQKGLEGSPGVRLFFYERVVEVLMPGQLHEIFKRVISSLLDAFFLTLQYQCDADRISHSRARRGRFCTGR